MDIKIIQEQTAKRFREIFGPSPLNERLDDILKEAQELKNWTDLTGLESEFGDLLSSVLAGIEECGFDAQQLLEDNERKLNRRRQQYRSLGRKVNVALFGGAFDPITMGHVVVAKFVLKSARMFDEVWIVPCFRHMYNKEMTPANHRLEMCKLAVADDPRIKVFPYEIQNELSGETYHFVKRLSDDPISETHRFSMIIGMDNANTFHKWVNYELLNKMMQFIVVPRKGERRVSVRQSADWYTLPPHVLLQPDHSLIEVSSSEVRELIKQYCAGESRFWSRLEAVVDESVLEYIRVHNLYGMTTGVVGHKG